MSKYERYGLKNPHAKDFCTIFRYPFSFQDNYPLYFVITGVITWREHPDTSDIKDATVPRFGHSHVIFCLILVPNMKKHGLSIISKNVLLIVGIVVLLT